MKVEEIRLVLSKVGFVAAFVIAILAALHAITGIWVIWAVLAALAFGLGTL